MSCQKQRHVMPGNDIVPCKGLTSCHAQKSHHVMPGMTNLYARYLGSMPV